MSISLHKGAYLSDSPGAFSIAFIFKFSVSLYLPTWVIRGVSIDSITLGVSRYYFAKKFTPDGKSLSLPNTPLCLLAPHQWGGSAYDKERTEPLNEYFCHLFSNELAWSSQEPPQTVETFISTVANEVSMVNSLQTASIDVLCAVQEDCPTLRPRTLPPHCASSAKVTLDWTPLVSFGLQPSFSFNY